MKKVILVVLLLTLPCLVFAGVIYNCKGDAGPGGPCYAGPGAAYDAPGGPGYDGPGGPCYTGPGGSCYNGSRGIAKNCPRVCK